jgi:hypothetical protein
MSEPTSAERAAIGTRLRNAVPTAPDLAGLATRVERGARSNRTRRRAAVAAAATLAVAIVVVVPQLLGSLPAHQSAPPRPVPMPSHPCSARPDHPDFTSGTGVWVTFCPATVPAGILTLPAAHPQGLLDPAASRILVSSWQRSATTDHSCPATFGATEFRILVGFADGSTSSIDGFVGACPAGVTPSSGRDRISSGGLVYSDLVSALGRQAANGHRPYNPPGPPRTCARALFSPGRYNVDGASARQPDDASMLLDMTAVEGLVCRYDGPGRLTGSGAVTDPEALRIASASSFMPRPFPQGRAAPATSYLVTLRDRTDTWRTFTVTGRKRVLTWYRGTAPGTPQRIGYAGETLLSMLHEAAR